MKLNADKLAMIPRATAASAAHGALDRIQGMKPEEQVAAVAVLFKVLCSRNNLDPFDVYSLGTKLIEIQPFHRKENVQIEALQDYAGFVHPTA